MNSSQAKKQIPIIGFLASQGRHPVEIRNGQAVFHSPFKVDKTASLYVDYKKYDIQVWKDFSTGAGGNILDLVMKMYNVDITGALIILQKPELSKPDLSFFSQQEVNTTNIEIKHIQPLQNAALVQYLNSRKISQSKAVNYVQEAYYKVNDKQYFALAFKNDKGGFELRNKYFKGSSSPKAITTIPGSCKAVNIFEGFIDFLSALEYYKTNKSVNTCIILNSVSNLQTIINTLEQYQHINLYLDNDNAGNEATDAIKKIFPTVKNYSKFIYPDHKDFNEYLSAGNPVKSQ